MDYGPALPPGLGSDHHNFSDQKSNASEVPSKKASDGHKRHSHSHRKHDVGPRSASDQYSDESDQPRMLSSKSKNMLTKANTNLGPGMFHLPQRKISPVAKHRSSKPSRARPSGANSDQDQPQHDPDPAYCREVALADVPSQYAEEMDTFRCILSLPDPRESMPRSSTSVMGLHDDSPRGPSSMLPLSSVIKDAFDKFEHDFKTASLPEGKYIKPPPASTKWYKVGQPCYEEKMQELNTDFSGMKPK